MATDLQNAPLELRRQHEFGEPTPNAVGRNAVVSYDGCVVHLEKTSAPRLMWYGEDLLSVKFPAGTRVLYPNPTIRGLRDRNLAIEYALVHPEGMDPLPTLLRPDTSTARSRSSGTGISSTRTAMTIAWRRPPAAVC